MFVKYEVYGETRTWQRKTASCYCSLIVLSSLLNSKSNKHLSQVVIRELLFFFVKKKRELVRYIFLLFDHKNIKKSDQQNEGKQCCLGTSDKYNVNPASFLTKTKPDLKSLFTLSLLQLYASNFRSFQPQALNCLSFIKQTHL